jgi:CHASE2 domain-containing sensor protein
MTPLWPTLVYLLCLATSALCAALLFRAWRQAQSRLLLWTAISFLFFALNNLALAADMIVFPAISLWPLRLFTQFIAFAVLLYGFVWESER